MSGKVIGGRDSFLVIPLALILYFGNACIATEHKVEGDRMILGKQDTGRQITIKAGDIIRIELEAIGGTGYWWYINDLDLTYLEFLSEETKAISDKGMTGASVMDIWRFKALKKGSAEIRLDYYRKWEGLEKAANQFRIKLIIE